MPLRFVRNDITKMDVDAVVLPANKLLEQGSGASRSIYMAAGEIQLEGELRLKYPNGCEMGKAVITEGYALPAKKIIHTVCPQWLGGDNGEADFLYSAYMEALILAEKNKCRSVAFPLLSTGSYRYPRFDAIKIAVQAILDFLTDNNIDVYLVFFGKDGIRDGIRLFGDIETLIDDSYSHKELTNNRYSSKKLCGRFDQDDWYDLKKDFDKKLKEPNVKTQSYDITNLKGESFREMLIRLIQESGMTDPEVYKSANLYKQTFNKIKQKQNYIPKKKTILAMAVALQLSSKTTRELLMKAGYALTDCDNFDLIMRYCFDSRMLNFEDINELLESYGLHEEVFPIMDKSDE